MRFRFFLFFFTFACTYAQAAQSQVEPPSLKQASPDKKTADKPAESPTVITADSVTAKENQVLEATGDAELRKDDQMIRADHLLFLQQSNELFADGAVRLEKSDTAVSGPSLQMNLDKNTGEMRKPSFTLSNTTLRGDADLLSIEGKQQYRFDRGEYTSCPVGNDDWLLKFSRLGLDRNTQIGNAYNARIEFKGVPILYTPWMNFPLNNQRRSGFLGPTIGGSNTGGNEITLPYYWNIASNYDATFSPRFIEKRGTLWDNEFRYLGNSYTGQLDYGELTYDNVTQMKRTHSTLVHSQNFGGGFSGSLNLNQASDDAYFRDLSSSNPALAVQKNLLQEEALSYSGGWWNSSLRAQSYQTLQDPDALVAVPFRRLPQFTLGAQRVLGGASMSLNAEYVNFLGGIPLASTTTLGSPQVNGERVVVYPTVSYPLVNDPGYYLTPKVGVHYTQYQLGDYNLTTESNYVRTLPIFSLDSGMTLERDFSAFNNEYVQTLEPRIFYVKIPYQNQDMLPIFDTTPAVFSFTQIFTENRFIGSDRIGDADQITTALTTRLLDGDTGNELLRIAVGERFSNQTPLVTITSPGAPSSATATTNQSDILIGVSGRMTKSITLNSLAQYNPSQSRTETFNITAQYRPEAGKVFNLGYRYQFDPDPAQTLAVKQLDLSSQWLLGGRWHMVGQLTYSLLDNRMVQTLAGLEYNQDCWAVRMVAQQFVTSLNQSSTTYFIQLELNDLIRLGHDPLSALKQSVPGYSVLNEGSQNIPK
jgi:LPS-assembly protein